MMMSEEKAYRTFFCQGNRFEEWEIIEEIGSGAIGKIFLAFMQIAPGKKSYATLNVIPANHISIPHFQKFLKQDYDILANLDSHVNIVKLLPQERHFLWQGDMQIFYVIQEYCPGNLDEFCHQYPERRMPVGDVFLCLEQIVSGCQYAHEENVIHGDLCAENILMMRPHNLKITNFGLSRIGKSVSSERRMLYQAPETIQSGEINPASDVWALGVLSYRLLSGEFPFQGENQAQLLRDIGEYRLKWPDFSYEHCPQMAKTMKYFTRSMLCRKPGQRPTCREIFQAMQRCRHQLRPAEVEKFEQRFFAHIESQDRCIDLEAKASQGLSAPPAQVAISHFRGLRTMAMCFALLGIIFFLQHFAPFRPPSSKVVIKLTPSSLPLAADRFALNVIIDRGKLEFPKTSEFKISLYYRHERGVEGKSEPGRKIFDSYIWRVPENWPDGKVDLWVEARINDFCVTSNAITLKVKGVYQDRREFNKARQVEERLKDKQDDYESIVESYRDYCLKFPQGLFKKKAREKLQAYDQRAASYRYRFLIESMTQMPANIKNILAECGTFLEKYKVSPYSAKVVQLQSSYRQLLVSRGYQITLIKGGCQSEYADSYVKIYNAGHEVYTSSIAKNQIYPTWSDSFRFTWKAGDTIKVEFWESDLLKDNRHFCVVDNTVFSIRLLSGRIEEGDYWIEFSSDFPTHLYSAATRKYFHR